MWSFLLGGMGELPGACRQQLLSNCGLDSAACLRNRSTLYRAQPSPNTSSITPCPPAGLVIPLVVPPIRDALGYNKPNIPNPPPVRSVRWGGVGG